MVTGSNKPKSAEEAWTLARVRARWVEFFSSKDHRQVSSASLIPAGDPTLLFTSAGMVQFKAYFAGTAKPPHPRLTSIQKCLRTTDLEEVGRTARHCTFFEMLGNFSFGDYFKHEAIAYAWEFSTEWLGFEPERIHISIFEDDDEAEEIWNKEVGVPLDRIVRLGRDDNWWGPAGDSGACGPCTELYLDRGAEHCTCKDPSSCQPGSECDRFMEYWNLVFNQYHQDTAGKLHPLPARGIDTGAGLERLAALLANVESVYDTDEMARVIERIETLTEELRPDRKRVAYNSRDARAAAPFRVLTDHIRTASFAIADGILPDNTGRGYVIRRVIRRALLFARELGIHEPILYRLAPLIVEIYGGFYPELKARAAEIERRVRAEEERFLNTLELGLKHWTQFLEEHRSRQAAIFNGKDAFTLYDTYGFPLEMTTELAEREGLQLDRDGFEKHMAEQRRRAAASTKWKDFVLPPELGLPAGTESVFTGYDRERDDGQIIALVADSKASANLNDGQEGIVILDRTPFYAEGGGQVGDIGKLVSKNGAVFEVRDTQAKGGLILHIGRVLTGTFEKGAAVTAEIDGARREALTWHHSATHLLNHALRETLGEHVMQTGSLVSPDYLRFDFSHPERISAGDLEKIEASVNAAIKDAAPVQSEVLPIEAARKKGAVAAFNEKYGEEVRVISMGSDGILSLEFCGGCHVDNTGNIGLFHILREASPGAGNRRIEAVAGERAVEHFQNELDSLHQKISDYNARVRTALDGEGDALLLDDPLPTEPAARLLRSPDRVLSLARELSRASEALAGHEKKLIKAERERKQAASGDLLARVDDLLSEAEERGPLVWVRHSAEADADSLRVLGDRLREKKRGIVVTLGSTGARPVLLFMADRAALDLGVDCAALIRPSAALLGGGGGGRPDMAQAGGKDAARMEEALALAGETLLKQLEAPATPRGKKRG